MARRSPEAVQAAETSCWARRRGSSSGPGKGGGLGPLQDRESAGPARDGVQVARVGLVGWALVVAHGVADRVVSGPGLAVPRSRSRRATST